MRRVRTKIMPGGLPDSIENVYVKKKCARWLRNLLKSGIKPEAPFLEVWEWSTGASLKILCQIQDTLVEMLDSASAVEVINDLQVFIKNRKNQHNFFNNLAEVMEKYPTVEKMAIELMVSECTSRMKISRNESATFSQAQKRLKRIFGLNKEQIALCEFVFITQSFKPVECYFDDYIKIFQLMNKKVLSNVLEIDQLTLQKCRSELTEYGILDINNNHDYVLLTEEMLPLLDTSVDKNLEALFFQPVGGRGEKYLPLEDFNVSPDELSHVKALLAASNDTPLHILFYGPPGTGKTTFAASLANAMELKAWSVPFTENSHKNGRKAALKSCLNMASQHKNAFVILDEADRFLDTGDHFSRTTTDKAWLNGLLEEPGRRMIWIVNDVEQIDYSVRRRFTFSINFTDLNTVERGKIWREILTGHHVKRNISEPELERLARDYKVPTAVIESAVRQAKTLTRSGRDFIKSTELALKAYVTLSRGGVRKHAVNRMEEEYTTAGVSIEGSIDELLGRCRRIDAICRGSEPIQAGGGTLLFYGPPGTGKTALAKHIARELDRECDVKRASDLLSCWVGASEKNVAEAFRRAESEGSILVIDEADSLLYSRETAVRSWESTLVNEFLTSLEDYRGFCICTTNRFQHIDAAALRRFAIKVSFGYAGPGQVETLYQSLLAPLASGRLKEDERLRLIGLNSLTPGDFKTVRSQFWLMDGENISHTQLIDSLAAEQSVKLNHGGRAIGF